MAVGIQWSRLMRRQAPGENEVALFIKALESQKINMGSGWHGLTVRAKRWAEGEGKGEI